MAVILCFLFIQRAVLLPLLLFVLLSSSPIAILFFSLCQCQHVSATILPPDHNNNINATDKSSLLVFESAISVDPHGVFAGWNDTVHFCKWQGITCGGHRHPDRVVALNLTGLDLLGTIPPALANLTFLRSIDLSYNHFNGQMPWQLGNLSRLEFLDLNVNSLEGYIPSEFVSLTSLTSLRLRQNNISGPIPPSLANMSSLVYLFLSENQLSGVIPPSLGELPNLEVLDVGANNLTGGITPSLGKLSKVTFFFLGFNFHLGGVIPPALWNLSSLVQLSLHSCGLYGSLPQDIDIGQAFPNLQFLSLFNNGLHGEIPLSLANASQLATLELGKNKFSGTIPHNLGRLQYLTMLDLSENQWEPNDWSFIASLSNCTILRVLQIGSNNLGGQLPKSLANLSTTLQELDIEDNNIYGSIPQDIGNLVNLTRLSLGPNLLTGPIPASFMLLNNLHHVYLSYNSLSGEIPHSIGNLSQLEWLYLDYNSFNGSIPTSLGNCKILGILSLDYNKLTGMVPKEVVSIHTLSQLSLSNNLLQGSIPMEVGNLTTLNTLIMSRNKFSGEIPIGLGNYLFLEFLYLDGNLFQGSIPTSLSSLRGLQELDLSRNNFSGEVPLFLENFHFLHDLNLSFNNFEGELPKNGVFANISAVSVLENYKLCGGNPMLHLQTCQFSSPKKKHKFSKIAIIISLASAFMCLFLLFVLVVVHYRMCRKSRRELPIDNNHIGDQYVNVSYDDLVKATDGFSKANLIGSGNFGSVYREKLENHEHSIRDVAVKVFNVQQPKALKSFMVECDAFRNIRHRNLIKIITACSSIDFRGNDFKALVLEFKANGSLESWLHPEESDHGIKKLSLVQRINIAIDVASALEYLHHHCQTSIIHCDLKPSNILLNDDMTALVSDFGIVKYMRGSIENSTCSSGIKGTIGYIPPEYGIANQVSTHGDVYSYGILLLELFTGRRPTDDIFKEGLSLRSFVQLALPEKVMDAVDVSMLQEGIDEPRESGMTVHNIRSLKCVASIHGIGLSCTKDLPIERMGITNVANELKAIRNCFLEK